MLTRGDRVTLEVDWYLLGAEYGTVKDTRQGDNLYVLVEWDSSTSTVHTSDELIEISTEVTTCKIK